MSNQYDADIVAQYDRSFTEIPLRRYVELPSVYQILGDVTGLCVLDLACGTGYYAKELRRRGAARVVGVDLSEAMMRATKAQEEKEPLGVEYVRADAGALERFGDFDLVIGIHLLHYANSFEHLSGMCKSISRNLKPAGRFIGRGAGLEPSIAQHVDHILNARVVAGGPGGAIAAVLVGDLLQCLKVLECPGLAHLASQLLHR